MERITELKFKQSLGALTPAEKAELDELLAQGQSGLQAPSARSKSQPIPTVVVDAGKKGFER